jgi:carboxyl-terminal processing protease
MNRSRTFRRVISAIAAVFLLSACSVLDPYRIISRATPAPVIPDTPVPMPNTNWKQDAIDFVWATVNERYYDAKFNGVDWQAVRKSYEPRLLATTDDDAFWELLDKMTGELKDSHTRVHSPKWVAQQSGSVSHGLGLGFAELDGALTVTSVHPQSDAWWAGVRSGMTILQIDERAALPHYQSLVSESRETSTPWARTRGALRKISAGEVDTRVSMRFARSDKTEFDVLMKRRSFASSFDFAERVLPSGFGYVRFSNFVGSQSDRIVGAIQRMKDTPGIILDLRGNGGGSGAMASTIIAQFLREDYKGTKLQTRTGRPMQVMFVTVNKLEPVIKSLGARAVTTPLVILTNESSASASEMVSMALKDAKRATLIGERTCGCLLAYMGLADVPGGAQMAYSEIGFVNRDGTRVEGNGVLPDIEVKPTRDDLLLARDRVLEAAVAHLSTVTTKAATQLAAQSTNAPAAP